MVLLQKHSHKCTLNNEKLNKLHNERQTMLYKLENKISGTEELKSAQTLNKKGHKLFLQLVSNSNNYPLTDSTDPMGPLELFSNLNKSYLTQSLTYIKDIYI